jgi:hypothetical protein
MRKNSRADEAVDCARIDWYRCRWLIEDFNMCLKTGCDIERSQLGHFDDIGRLLGFKLPVAVRLLQLRQLARTETDSGGPNFIGDSNVVGGVTSFGLNGNCAGTGGVYRVDQADDLNWLNSAFGAYLP